MKHKNRINAVRKAQGVSRAVLARRLGLHMVTVYRHESGQVRLSAKLAARYAEALGVPVLELFMDRAAPGANAR